MNDNNGNLFQKILECDESEIDSIVTEAIEKADENAQSIEQLGFTNLFMKNPVFEGFIPLKTRIKYSNLGMEDYGMATTDYIYEFAHFVRDNNINNKKALVYNVEPFINYYFGLPGQNSREEIFYNNAWQTSTNDDDFFDALDKNMLGDLKGMGAAQCTERAALAQQVLSLFGSEIYYCMGCADFGEWQEPHSFNIIKRKNDYAVLDYSVPVESYNLDGDLVEHLPFVGVLTNEEFSEFINTGNIKTFEDYCYVGGKKQEKDNQRSYVAGEFEIEKEKETGASR